MAIYKIYKFISFNLSIKSIQVICVFQIFFRRRQVLSSKNIYIHFNEDEGDKRVKGMKNCRNVEKGKVQEIGCIWGVEIKNVIIWIFLPNF